MSHSFQSYGFSKPGFPVFITQSLLKLMPNWPVAAAASAKLLQSCPTRCDPIHSSPPGSPVPGILQERILEWVAISFSNAWKWKVKGKLLSHVQFSETPMDCSLPGSSIHGITQVSVLEWVAIWPVSLSKYLILCHLLLFLLSTFPRIRVFPLSRVLASGGRSTGTLTLASVLPMNMQGWFPLDWLIWFLCHPRDSQESSLTPQFESINSQYRDSLWSSCHIVRWQLGKP